jgi:hypothetical protein
MKSSAQIARRGQAGPDARNAPIPAGSDVPVRIGAAGQRWLNAASIGFFVWYSVYVLMLGKLFSPEVTPDWYRDLGILWDLADATVRNGHYPPAYYFPPPNAVLAHLYGLADRDLAFRIYLVAELAAVGLTIWAWARLIGLDQQPRRAVIILTAFLAAHTYIHFELHMHNTNAVTLALVSVALAFERRTGFSAGCYAFSMAVKPYSSALILPWMAWNRKGRWTTAVLCWLVLLFGVLPAMWFGVAESGELYREWIASLLTVVSNDDPHQLSVRAGIAAVGQRDISDPLVRWTALALQATWIAAVAAFFLPALRRPRPCSGMPAACECAAILLIGLPLGNHQQPARGIMLLTATLVISSVALDAQRSGPLRAVLGGILVAIAVSSHVIPIGPLHFLLTLPICLLALTGLAIVRALSSAGTPPFCEATAD